MTSQIPDIKNLKSLLMESAKEWSDDKASRLGASLAYYTVFSIAPLLLIAIAIAGFVLGEDAARGTISAEVGKLVGPEAGQAIEGMVDSAGKNKGTGVFATIVSVVMLLFGASGVFVQLKDALNTIWDVPDQEVRGGIMGFLKARILSFGFVLGVGFLLLVSLVVSVIISAAGSWLGGSEAMGLVIQAVNLVVSLGVITVIFAMIFKFLPDIKLPWRDVWLGAVITAILFTIGKWALGVYLGRSSVASAYGAAGSLVVLLLWVYYSAQIAFFGAEITQVYSRRHGAWQGRRKRTEVQKRKGELPDTTPTDTPPVPPASQGESTSKPVPDADNVKPNAVGMKVGKLFGLAVAGKAIIDALKAKRR